MALNDHIFDAGGAVYNVMNPEFDDVDDTVRIQKALDKAGNIVTHPRGAVVYLPAAYVDGENTHNGVYEIRDYLNYPSNVHICGAGDGTVLRLADGIIEPPSALLRPKPGGVQNVTISDMTIDGNEEGYSDPTPKIVCIRLNRGLNSSDQHSFIRVQRVTFRNVHTIAVHANSNSGYVSDVQISDCVVESSRLGGFSLFGKFKNFLIANNRLSNVGDDAIAIQGALPSVGTFKRPHDVVIRNNVMWDLDRRSGNPLSTPHGILVFSADDVTITGNSVHTTVASGIAISYSTTEEPCQNIVIAGNNVRDAGRATTDTTVRKNGIDVLQGRNVVVFGNSVRGGRGHGIVVTDSDRVAVVGNEVSENDHSGICIEPARDVTVHGNTVTDNGTSSSLEPFGVALRATSLLAPKNIVVTGNRVGNSSANPLSTYRQQVGVLGFGVGGGGSTPSNPNDLVIAGNDLRRNFSATDVQQPISGPLDNATVGATGFDQGSTAGRPAWARVGQQYFDTTINKPVWFNGSAWVLWDGS